jgi:hypothetical protein
MEDPKPVKLPYFHRTLSAEETALIGDITPKPITQDANVATQPRNVLEGSAWNAAQTWEERDCTKWGKDKVSEKFNGSFGAVEFSDITKLEGHASITHVRGRARFMYEWSFTFTAKLDGEKVTVEISEAINDQLDDVNFNFSFSKKSLNSERKNQLTKQIQAAAIGKLQEFEAEFHSYRPT